MKTRNLISFDWAMKRLLRNKANFEVLEGFLSELLHRNIIIKNISESEANKEYENEKGNTVDILVEADESELFIIELQYNNLLFYFHRLLYGVVKTLANYLEKGTPYDKIRKIYSISIVHYGIGEVEGEKKDKDKTPDDYIYHGFFNMTGVHSKNELRLTPGQRKTYNKTTIGEIMPEYYIIKLNNFNDVAVDTLDQWIYFLKHNKIEKNFTAKGFKKVEEVLNYDNLSPEEKIAHDKSIDRKLCAENAVETASVEGEIKGLEKGEAIGIEKGKAEGKAEEKTETAINCFNEGIPIEAIAKITNMTVEEIMEILNINQKSKIKNQKSISHAKIPRPQK